MNYVPLMTRFAVAFVVAALAICVPANADTIAGEQAMSDPVALHEVTMGVAWWQKHGVTGCPQGVVATSAPEAALKQATGQFLDDDNEVIDGMGWDCAFTLSDDVYDVYGTNRVDYRLDRHCRRSGARYFCTDEDTTLSMRDAQSYRCSRIRHELGHAIGGLDDDPITDDEDIAWAMQGQDVAATYDDCEALARATWRYRPIRHRIHRNRHHRSLSARVLRVLSTGH